MIMQKRGSYFFVLDVFIAAAVLVLTIIIILSSRANVPDTTQSFLLAEDFMQFMTSTEVRDLTSNFKTQMVLAGEMSNTELNLYQQVAKFYFENKSNLSYGFVESLANGMIPGQYGFSYVLNGTVIYNRSIEKLDSSDLVLVSKKITFFKINTKQLFGPVMTEVKVWV